MVALAALPALALGNTMAPLKATGLSSGKASPVNSSASCCACSAAAGRVVWSSQCTVPWCTTARATVTFQGAGVCAAGGVPGLVGLRVLAALAALAGAEAAALAGSLPSALAAAEAAGAVEVAVAVVVAIIQLHQ